MLFVVSAFDQKFAPEALTFDDVLLLPAYSEVTPNAVRLSSRLTKNITLNIPLLSAAMDTVTESAMAIALARAGGIGVVHKNMPLEAQARMVLQVKRSEAGMIVDPITLGPDALLEDAARLMAEFGISGVPKSSRELALLLSSLSFCPNNVFQFTGAALSPGLRGSVTLETPNNLSSRLSGTVPELNEPGLVTGLRSCSFQ